MSAAIVFRVDLPHGRCVGVRVPEKVEPAMLAEFSEEERSFFATVSLPRRSTWLSGRIALHLALRDLGVEAGPILATKRGAPQLPSGLTGSISHKPTLAVALAAHSEGGVCVGVDIEPIPNIVSSSSEPGWDRRPDISNRVMTPQELTALAGVPTERRRREIILHFSIKEALYKAINPLIGRYVSFQEAIVLPHVDGHVEVTLALCQKEGPFSAEARWSEIDGHLLTTARVRLTQ
jgi:phosphopantetheine--protein transferase-like protein